MPELPEVETILQNMKPCLMGRSFGKIDVNRPNLRTPFPAGLATIPLHHPIIALRRRAKYILIDFQHGWSLLIHLGMSGRLFIDPTISAPASRKHEHLVFWTNDDQRIAFVDARRFGMVALFRTDEESQQPQLAHLGIEPLSPHFTADYLYGLCRTIRMPLKTALLDQRKIVGLGNIYVCEALFRAGLHPQREAKSLTQQDAVRLHHAIIEILDAAIKAGGSTLRDYVHTDGTPGAFQNLHLVYGREGEPCPSCTQAARQRLIERITQNGRSTFFCPHCQKNKENA